MDIDTSTISQESVTANKAIAAGFPGIDNL